MNRILWLKFCLNENVELKISKHLLRKWPSAGYVTSNYLKKDALVYGHMRAHGLDWLNEITID